jgi:hypothetical protein
MGKPHLGNNNRLLHKSRRSSMSENKAINETKVHYEKMMYKEALKTGFFEYQVNKYLLCFNIYSGTE